jgi:nucleotide-binding universal stress UspA family protein
MTKTVIVPLDGSDFALRALRVGTAFARAFDAELLLVTTPMTLEEHRPSELPVWLPEAAAASQYARVRTELLPEHDELTALERCAARVAEPAICMATRGRGALGTAVLGSVAQRVVHELGVATTLVGPNSDSEWQVSGPIVVCHDGSPASDAILPIAGEWARALHLRAVIVNVSRPRDAATASAPRAAIERAAAMLHDDLADDGVQMLSHRHSAAGILGLVDDIDASLVALSTHGRSARGRFTLGRVSGAVIHAAPCPVLTTRPANLSTARIEEHTDGR